MSASGQKCESLIESEEKAALPAAAAELRTCCLCCCLTSGVWVKVASGLSEELLVREVKKVGCHAFCREVYIGVQS